MMLSSKQRARSALLVPILFTPILLTVGLTGCSASKQLEDRVTRVEQGLEDLRVVHADIIARIDTLENQARNVTGKVEELAYSQSYQIGGDVSSLKQDLSRLQRRMPPPALVPLAALEEDEVLVRNFEPETARNFSNALTRIRTGSYREALPLFRALANSPVGDDVRARALFWAGVCEEGLGNNPDALRAYHTLAQDFPTHSRVPLTLLRQSSVFVRLRDLKSAELTLQKLISQFPKSSEAVDGREKLKRLK